MKKVFKWVLSALYGLMMIEIIIMVSPFAFYWYSLYAPTLQGLNRWSATAWLDAFFLPHAVITNSRFLEFLRWDLGTYCFSVGILGFLFCAGQIYYAQLFKKGVVHSWIYSHVRHPQYFFLSVAGFGLLTMWPRIIILMLYVGMLFIYYFLARFEEKQMEAKYPGYAEYRQRTAMFVPGNPGGKLFRLLFGWIPSRRLALASLALVVAFGSVVGAFELRRYTLRHTAGVVLPESRVLAISIWPMPKDQIKNIVTVALQDPQVQSALAAEQGESFTAHVLPENYSMMDMFADVGGDHMMFGSISPQFFRHLGGMVLPFLVRHHREHVMGTPNGDYEVVFSRVDGPDRHPVAVIYVAGSENKMSPVVIARVTNNRAQRVVIPPHQSLWGDITMPMF